MVWDGLTLVSRRGHIPPLGDGCLVGGDGWSDPDHSANEDCVGICSLGASKRISRAHGRLWIIRSGVCWIVSALWNIKKISVGSWWTLGGHLSSNCISLRAAEPTYVFPTGSVIMVGSLKVRFAT